MSAMTTDWRPMGEINPKHGDRVLISYRGRVVIATWDAQPRHKRPRPFWSHDDAPRAWCSRENPPERWQPLPEAYKGDGMP